MISFWLTTFLLNAVWQITAIALLAFASARLLRRLPSRYVHKVWVVALLACVLVPVLTVVIQHQASSNETTTMSSPSPRNSQTSSDGSSIRLHSVNRSILLPRVLTIGLLWTFILSFSYRSLWLGWGLYRTRRMMHSSHTEELPPVLSDIAKQCMLRFSIGRVLLLSSDTVPTPSTVGHRSPIVFLPKSFCFTEFRRNEFITALAHEFAHIQRQDFLLNLLYEVVSLPLSFHPFMAFIKARLAQTRELACDELAAQMLPSTTCYATSLLRIAESLSSRAATRQGFALGLFDTSTLEERIVNVLKRRNLNTGKARALRVAAACLVGAVALGTSVFSLKLAAENGSDLLKFAGTWECKYNGRAFFTLKLAMKDGVLGGTAIHSTSVAWVDGEIIPNTNEMTNDKIFETHASGKELHIKIADGPNDADPVALNFRLTGKNEADAKFSMEKQADAPPQAKPWHFVRIK
jgi:bla regulator protein blaR1